MDRNSYQCVGNLEGLPVNGSKHLDAGLSSHLVMYIHSEDYLSHCNRFWKVAGRAALVHSLIDSYQLLKYMKVVSPRPADDDDLALFHSSSYLQCLKSLSNGDLVDESEQEEYGLNYDCPAYAKVFECCKLIAGASIMAANCLIKGECSVSINWSGGWHHAKKDEASGFCYINDVVLCILKLLTTFSHVLYVDLDLHHGDGVQDAFCATAKVMTVSFHKHSPGFFPGTGAVDECGIGKGKHFAVNVPLKDGVNDEMYIQIFDRVIDMVLAQFPADAIVCQCGADGIAGDPEASFNLTPQALIHCTQRLLRLQKPLVLLGGGGYNFANTARCWTAITASVLGKSLHDEIPDDDKYFTWYGSGYELKVDSGNMRNHNDITYIKNVLSTVQANLSHLVRDSSKLQSGPK